MEEATNDKAKKNATFTNEELLALADNCCLPVTNVHKRQEPQSAPVRKQPRENVIYVQFYVDVLNYLFYVINVTILWAGA